MDEHAIYAFIIIFFFMTIFCMIFIYIRLNSSNDQTNIPISYKQVQNKIQYNNDDAVKTEDTNQICMTKDIYDKLLQDSKKECSIQQPESQTRYQYTNIDARNNDIGNIYQQTQLRDQRVLHDQLYPPLNRIDTISHSAMNMQVMNRNMYIPMNDIGDTYRLVGYLTSNEETYDKGGNSWKLFARQKNRHISDFYIVPANKNYDLKIHLKDEMIIGTRLRDVYTIPNEITFSSPFLHKTPYTFIENEKTDYSSSLYM